MPIRPLPTLLVNQIAAGEVIERPASVVKELVENAIDAGASSIRVAVERGGRDLVEVADDGSGIPADELVLAVAPHATSKIAEAADLDAIATMGFRGEALASIASVSRLTIRSRPADAASGAELVVEGGTVTGPRPAAAPVGTTVTVRNLFFNTPARRKFLRTDRTETQRVVAVVESLAIAHPSIAFELVIDGRRRFELPAETAARRRVVAVLGAELEPELLELEADARGLGLWGLLGTPNVARGTARDLRVFLNGRPIADRTVQHAVREAYRGLIAPDRHPTVVLLVRIDPADVDVNVHPAKAEVRFRRQSDVHGTIRGALLERLRAADLVPQVDLGRAHGGTVPSFGSGLRPASAPSWGEPYAGRAEPKGFDVDAVRRALDAPMAPSSSLEGAPTLAAPAAPVAPAVAIHHRYLVTEDEQGLVIIDQHALHERIMFERLLERTGRGPLQSQRLLVPAEVPAEPDDLDRLEALAPLLARLGIEAEPLGPRAIAVRAFPTLLFERNVEPVPFMSDLLRRAAERRYDRDPEGALHEVLDMMACKAAVRSGDRLSDREVRELLTLREQVERSERCPHGRPTTLKLSMRELDRQFGRH